MLLLVELSGKGYTIERLTCFSPSVEHERCVGHQFFGSILWSFWVSILVYWFRSALLLCDGLDVFAKC